MSGIIEKLARDNQYSDINKEKIFKNEILEEENNGNLEHYKEIITLYKKQIEIYESALKEKEDRIIKQEQLITELRRIINKINFLSRI